MRPGTYPGKTTTVRSGRTDAPIRITGQGAYLKGDGSGRLLQVMHNYFTIEGLDFSSADILLWIQGARGVRVLNNRFHDAGGECVRVKYFSVGNEIAYNNIDHCGKQGFDVSAGRKNGEGIYIGTAPEQLYKNPTSEPDQSNENWIHHNVVNPRAECVDVKEHALKNLVEHNRCTGSEDPDGGGFSSRGNQTIFRNNTSTGHVGAGIRLGGDTSSDGVQNQVIGNTITNNGGYGVKVQRTPQGPICGNTLASNASGTTNGSADPAAACP